MMTVCAILMSCDKNEILIETPSARGTMTDNEGNVYQWVRIGDQDWMTSNALCGTPYYDVTYNIWGYPEKALSKSEIAEAKINIPKYGNLLSYEEAVECAPEGWRLPTDEDWQKLEKALGMSGKDANSLGWRGNGVSDMLQQCNEGTELNMQFSGALLWTASYGLELSFMHFKEFGYYWTSTVDNSYTDYQAVYYRKLCYGNSKVERQVMRTNRYLSVRYMRDAK